MKKKIQNQGNEVEMKCVPSGNEAVAVGDEFSERKKKMEVWRAAGGLPYAERFERTEKIVEVRESAGKNPPRALEEITAAPNLNIKICGRLVLMRPHGKLTFAKLRDQSGEIQICFMQDFLNAQMAPESKKSLVVTPTGNPYKDLKFIDVGDFVGVTGELFVTKHGEVTLLVSEYKLLSKTLRPLPEKFHGLQDQEAKYRYRYLDMLSDPESFNRFIFRSKLITTIRNFLDTHDFLEVETPVLTNTASGAAAKPFVTHHKALDIEMYLRIATETFLKRAVAGGYERVYEFGKCFRNEGMDPSHLQEFNMLEYYASYWNYEDNMNFTEKLIVHTIEKLNGSLKVKCKDRDGGDVEIDFASPWPRVSFVDLIAKDCGINILDHYGDAKSLLKEIKAKKIMIEGAETLGYGNLCDALYKKVSRPKLIQPCFVIKHPVDTKPLARRNDSDPRIADTFQVLVNTWEIVNAYSELVDPVDQRDRLMRQADAKAAGDEEAMPMDEEFLRAMEHGMPPMSGWGMGIDRLVALLTSQDNLKDTVLFPLMRPE